LGNLDRATKTMNDPHIVALNYKIEAGENTDFDSAAPIDIAVEEFSVALDKSSAKFLMKVHYAMEDEAKAAVEPFINSWHVLSDLQLCPGVFRLCYVNAEIIDRASTPGIVELHARPAFYGLNVKATLSQSHSKFPEPPLRFRASELVNFLHHQYIGYRQGKMSLAAVGYFCADALEEHNARYGISSKLLKRMSRLCTEKGGKNARKILGARQDLSSGEKIWLEQAIKTIIRRVGEKDANPSSDFPQITSNVI
jgi:hypothetical protein